MGIEDVITSIFEGKVTEVVEIIRDYLDRALYRTAIFTGYSMEIVYLTDRQQLYDWANDNVPDNFFTEAKFEIFRIAKRDEESYPNEEQLSLLTKALTRHFINLYLDKMSRCDQTYIFDLEEKSTQIVVLSKRKSFGKISTNHWSLGDYLITQLSGERNGSEIIKHIKAGSLNSSILMELYPDPSQKLFIFNKYTFEPITLSDYLSIIS